MKVNPSHRVFTPTMLDNSRTGYSFLTNPNITERDELTLVAEEDVQSTSFQFYSLKLAGCEVGYFFLPLRGVIKNFGVFMVLASSRLLRNPAPQNVFNLGYRFDDIRIYRYGSQGIFIGDANVKDCLINTFLN